MVNLLRRVFIKNYLNVENPTVRTSHGKLAAGFGIFSNVILFTLKLIFGLLAASISIVADSINNLSDFANSIITLIGFKVSSKPADKKHPFGHQRIEYITGLIVSIVIVALALLLLYQSIERIVTGAVATYTIWSFIILAVSIFIKLLQAYFNYMMSKIINSVALKATCVDSITDSIATTLLLIGALLSYFLSWNIDGWMGIVISLFVGFAGVKMIIETSNPLIGQATSYEEVKKIVDEILAYKGVLGVHDLVAHNYGPTKIFMTIHVEVDAKKSFLETHELIDDIEMDIKKKFNVELTIHMDPIDIDNPETNRLKEKVVNILKDISSSMSVHDFRVVHGKNHTNVLFDVVVPYELKLDTNELLKILKTKINENESSKINIIVNFDRPFVEDEK